MRKDDIKTFSLTIHSSPKELLAVEKLSEKVADSLGFSDENKDNLAIVVTEAVNNAIVHGNKNDPSKKIFVEFTATEQELKIVIKDEGNGFDPGDVKNPTAPENIMKESGRGIFILKSLMDSVEFSFSSEGTAIILKKKIGKG